jgi:hypothetical protein
MTLDGFEWRASRCSRFTSGEINARFPLNMRLGGPQSCSESFEEDIHILALQGIELWPLGLPARSLVTVLAELLQLPACKLNLNCFFLLFVFKVVSAFLYVVKLECVGSKNSILIIVINYRYHN